MRRWKWSWEKMKKSENTTYKRAIVKLNGGYGALLCNRCWTMLAVGNDHGDVEHYCDGCRKQLRIAAKEAERQA